VSVDIARRERHSEPAVVARASADDSTSEREAGAVRDRIAALVGDGRRVLELGCGGGALSRALQDRGCRVVAVEADPAQAVGAADSCERIIVGDLDHIDLAAELGGDRFEVVVAADVLERLRDPAPILRAAQAVLRPGGWLVASVANVAQARVRLALWHGRFPCGEPGAIDRRLSFFTRDVLIRVLEAAGFAIGRIESIERRIDDDAAPIDTGDVPDDRLADVFRDRDAQIDRFLVVAYPLPRPGLDWIQQRLRSLAEETEAATREAEDLRRTVTSLTTFLAFLSHRAESAAAGERATREQLLALHDQLARDHEEFRGTARELIAQRDALAARLARIRDSLPGRIYRGARTLVRTFGKQ
jgi:SAM-dependent methyltransferase